MIEVKCKARNENNLPPHTFQKLFKEECMKEGQLVSLQFINDMAFGVVIK